MRRSSLALELDKEASSMDFGYATSVDDIFDTPAKREDWTEDDVEEGRPLLRVGSWSKDAPRSRRAKILACVMATVIFGPKASRWSRGRGTGLPRSKRSLAPRPHPRRRPRL